MRHPIYMGLRADKQPKQVHRELPEILQKENQKKPKNSISISNPSKIFWPKEKITKGHVIDYYEFMAETILPYLKDRPQNLHRHPNGIKGKSFFQKNISNKLPDYVKTMRIYSESGKKYINYLICNNQETLLFLANLGCIELNPWNSKIQNLDYPDYMILDLDPNGRPFSDLIIVAKAVKSVLDSACVESFPKTSGKTGLHVVIPLKARYNHQTVRTFAELLSNLVHKKVPKISSIERSPGKRKNKIYLDYLQNRYGQTLASVYSLRPYPGATISTPLKWTEIKKGLDPARYNIKTIKHRLEKQGDLWQPILKQETDIPAAIKCLEEADS